MFRVRHSGGGKTKRSFSPSDYINISFKRLLLLHVKRNKKCEMFRKKIFPLALNWYALSSCQMLLTNGFPTSVLKLFSSPPPPPHPRINVVKWTYFMRAVDIIFIASVGYTTVCIGFEKKKENGLIENYIVFVCAFNVYLLLSCSILY